VCVLKSNKESWGFIYFTQRKFCKEKKEMRSLNTQGKSEHKENELKSIKILCISKIGLQPIQSH
jgi:hypothetical protein